MILVYLHGGSGDEARTTVANGSTAVSIHGEGDQSASRQLTLSDKFGPVFHAQW